MTQNIFLSLVQGHCDQGLINVMVNYFQIWNKKEHKIISSSYVISKHMGPMYIETPYTYLPNPSARVGYDKRSIFKAEFNRSEFRVFFLLDELPNQGWRT